MESILGVRVSHQNEGESSESHNIGLNQINDPDNPRADIVFVHGLGGNYRETWRSPITDNYDQRNQRTDENDNKNNFFWPEILGGELNCRVWLFGYEAPKTFVERGHGIPLYYHADSLLGCLKARQLGQQPLFFITHSLGGLVVKKMLAKAVIDRETEILQQLKGVVFIATPHDGAGVANIASAIPIMAKIVRQLTEHNTELQELNDWYQTNAVSSDIYNLAFYETYNTGGVCIVVNRSSANPNIPPSHQEPLIAVQKDHIAIAKCEKQDDVVYSLVKQFIEKHLPRQTDSQDPKYKRFDPIWHEFNSRTDSTIVPFLGSGINLCDRDPISENILDLFSLSDEDQKQLSDSKRMELIKAKQSSLSEIELAFILSKAIRERMQLLELLDNHENSTDIMEKLMGLPCRECYSDIIRRPPDCPIWRQIEISHDSSKKLLSERLSCPLAIEQRLAIAKMNIRFLSQYLLSIDSLDGLYQRIEDFYKICKPNRLHNALANLIKKMPNLPFKLLVTTNYDDLLEKAFLNKQIAFDVVSYTRENTYGKSSFICHSYDQNGDRKPKELIQGTTNDSKEFQFQYPVISNSHFGKKSRISSLGKQEN